jgi:hypothetical protein
VSEVLPGDGDRGVTQELRDGGKGSSGDTTLGISGQHMQGVGVAEAWGVMRL